MTRVTSTGQKESAHTKDRETWNFTDTKVTIFPRHVGKSSCLSSEIKSLAANLY